MLKRAIAPKRFHDIPIARLLSLTFGLLVLLSIGVVLALTVSANVKNTFSLLNTRSVESVQSLKMLIDAYLEPVELTVRSLAGQIGRSELPLDDERAMMTILHGAITANRMVVAFEVYDLEGNVFGVFRQGPVFGEYSKAPVENPVIVEALSQLPVDGKPHWGELVAEQGVVHANVSLALEIKGKHVGALVAAVPLPRLSALVDDIGRTTEGTPFILDGPDHVLAHPLLVGPRRQRTSLEAGDNIATEVYLPDSVVGQLISQNRSAALNDQLPPPQIDPAQSGATPSSGQGRPGPRPFQGNRGTIPLAEFGSPILAAYPDREEGDMFEEAAEVGVEVSAVRVDGKQHIMLTSKVTTYAERPWIVGVYLDGDRVDREIERLVGSTMAGIVFLIIGVAFAFWLGRRLGRPIAQLNAMAGRVTTLDFDNVREMPPSRIREFNETALILNTMVDALRAFAAYVPRRLVTRLIETGAADAARSQERNVTLMFTDIASFTALSERMSATETADFLNEHFGIMCAEVDQSGGTVDKFMGDGMMAFWGAPDDMEDHAERAVRASERMAEAMARYNAARAKQGEPPVRVRIGIHTGPVVVGNIGSSDRMNYTIVGDTVNTCQRLEALGKVVDPTAECVALLSAETEKNLPVEILREALSAFHVPGREAPIQVHRLSLSQAAEKCTRL